MIARARFLPGWESFGGTELIPALFVRVSFLFLSRVAVVVKVHRTRFLQMPNCYQCQILCPQQFSAGPKTAVHSPCAFAVQNSVVADYECCS